MLNLTGIYIKAKGTNPAKKLKKKTTKEQWNRKPTEGKFVFFLCF